MLSIFMYKARPSALRSSSSVWHQAWQTYFCHINLFIQINVSIFHHMSSEIQWGSSWGTGTNDSSWETGRIQEHRHVFLHFHMNIQIFAWSGGIEKCWACQEHGGETQVQVPSGQVSSLKSMNFCILMNFCIALIPGYCAPRPIEGHRQHDPGGLCGPNHQSLALRLECIGILEPQIFIPIKKGFFKTTWSNQVLNGLRKKRVLLNNLEPPSPQSHFFVPLPSELKVFFWGWLDRKQGRVIVTSRCFARFAMKFVTQRIGDQASTNCESPFRVTSKVANCAMSLLNQNRFGWQRRSNGDFGTLSKMTRSVLWMLWWGLRMVCRFKRRIGFTTATTPIPFFQVWANPSPAAWVLSCSVPLWLKQGFQTQRQRPTC